MRSKNESIATCGWNTYAGIVATNPDDELDLPEIQVLLERVVAEIDNAPNKVRYTMNGFVISVGTYVKPLLKEAKAAAGKIGAVEVDMGDTACQVPLATAYIEKVEKAGRIGKKRKSMMSEGQRRDGAAIRRRFMNPPDAEGAWRSAAKRQGVDRYS